MKRKWDDDNAAGKNPYQSISSIRELDPDPDLRNEIRCRFHSSSTRCFFCWVGWSALIRLDRVDHVGIFTMNDPPGEASHGTPLINKTGEIEYTGITPIPISVKWHSFNQSSPPLSLSLASTFTYLLASVVDFAPSAPPFNKQFSGCSLLNEAIGTAALIALSQWERSYRGRAPIRALTNPSLASSTGWLHTAFCLTMAFRKQDPSFYHSIERTSHTESFN